MIPSFTIKTGLNLSKVNHLFKFKKASWLSLHVISTAIVERQHKRTAGTKLHVFVEKINFIVLLILFYKYENVPFISWNSWYKNQGHYKRRQQTNIAHKRRLNNSTKLLTNQMWYIKITSWLSKIYPRNTRLA